MEFIKYANQNMPLDDKERQKRIEEASGHFGEFMSSLGFKWEEDPNSRDTPMRFAKAIVNDICSGCFHDGPKITAFDNTDNYDGIVAQTNIDLKSICSHHWMPFSGVAHVGYIPSAGGKVIGLSKLNRVVDWFARRPQVQESLTSQISKFIDEICVDNQGVAVVIEANHTCCSNRGIKHNSTMRTARMTGTFLDKGDTSRVEFYKFIEFAKKDIR